MRKARALPQVPSTQQASARSWSRRNIIRLVVGTYVIPEELPEMTLGCESSEVPYRKEGSTPGMGTFAGYDGKNLRLGVKGFEF